MRIVTESLLGNAEYQRRWRERNPDYQKNYRQNNKDKVNSSTSNYHRKRYSWLVEQKNKPCLDCGGTFPPECMDFDHRTGETKEIKIGSSIRRSLDSLIKEIEKCDLVCANCHRIRTRKRREGFEI